MHAAMTTESRVACPNMPAICKDTNLGVKTCPPVWPRHERNSVLVISPDFEYSFSGNCARHDLGIFEEPETRGETRTCLN